MTWVAVGVAVAGAGTAAYSANAAKNAAGEQTGAVNRGIQGQVSQDAQNRGDNAQFLNTGTAANKRLAQLLGINQSAPTWDDAVAEHMRRHKEKFGVGYTEATPMDVVQQQTKDIYDQMQSKYNTEQAAQNPADTGSLLKKFSSADLAADPVYNSGLQFGLDEGEKGINARATQAGNYDSGATLKALTRFGNDYGSTKAGDSYNRFTNDQNNTFNRLSGISGTGQVATGQVQASGTNMANNNSNLAVDGGNARAAGIVGGANAWNGAVQTGANAANNYQQNEILKKLLAGRGANVNATGGQSLAQPDYSAGYY